MGSTMKLVAKLEGSFKAIQKLISDAYFLEDAKGRALK